MAVALISSFSSFINPSWLTGPIFDKELRVSSRRRRNYVLRSAYLLVLVFLVAGAWSIALLSGSGKSVAWQVSRSAEIGRSLVLTITWFQFLTAQVLAAVMLSNSISDEIRRGTMDVLMTTPINCVQIVLGKLFSRLFQLILMLAVSLPLLAVIRVFGGIQWDYVVSVSPFVSCHTDYDDLLNRCLSNHDSGICLSQFKQLPDERDTAYQSFRSDDSGYFSRLPGFPPGHYILFFAVTLSGNGGRFDVHTFCISI
jgi:hypothetical protein